MTEEVLFSHCLKCGKPYEATGHVCHLAAISVIEHCCHCGGDYPVGQGHVCVSAETEIVTLLRAILHECMAVRDEIAALRMRVIARWGP